MNNWSFLGMCNILFMHLHSTKCYAKTLTEDTALPEGRTAFQSCFISTENI